MARKANRLYLPIRQAAYPDVLSLWIVIVAYLVERTLPPRRALASEPSRDEIDPPGVKASPPGADDCSPREDQCSPEVIPFCSV